MAIRVYFESWHLASPTMFVRISDITSSDTSQIAMCVKQRSQGESTPPECPDHYWCPKLNGTVCPSIGFQDGRQPLGAVTPS